MSLVTFWVLLLVAAFAAATGYSTGTYVISSTVTWAAFTLVAVILLIVSIGNDIANRSAARHDLPETETQA